MASENGAPGEGFIEIFHSKPSWKRCYLISQTGPSTWSPPAQNPLVWAGHVRDGFRVHRMPARPLVFALTNGTARQWEDNDGKYYHVDAPGRYVVEHGIRRVGDADDSECRHAIERPGDAYVQLLFTADHSWGTECFFVDARDGGKWTEAPGTAMKLVQRSSEGNVFAAEVQARRLEFAFTDGAERWDSNLNKNYKVGLPGKYAVTNGHVQFLGPADKDLKREKDTQKAAGATGLQGDERGGTGSDLAAESSQAKGVLAGAGETRMPVGAK